MLVVHIVVVRVLARDVVVDVVDLMTRSARFPRLVARAHRVENRSKCSPALPNTQDNQ
jgi:hypothetical protein